MTTNPHHIVTSNFIPVTEAYFLDISKPHLERTMRSGSPVTKTYTLAGKIIRVHWYGSDLARITSLALEHHLVDNDDDAPTLNVATTNPTTTNFTTPDLTIYAWDDSMARTTPTPPWKHSSFNGAFDSTQSFYGVYVSGEESLSMYDTVKKTGYFWTHDALRLPGWVPSAPFRTILHWFLNESSTHLMHGAVIGTADTSVLLTAKGGSGKSTTAISCLLSGMNYLADDYIAVTCEAAPHKPRAHSLYQSAKITEHGMRYFPELVEKIWNTDFETREDKREKALFFLKDHFPNQVKRTAELSAIFIPQITGGETRIVPASKMAALLAIAPTSLLQLPLAETNKIKAFKEIISHIPCYTLELGPDVRSVPEVIKQFLYEH